MNLKNNNIVLKRDKIKYLLQKYHQEKYESDYEYLEDISKMKITLDESNINMKNLQFCYKYANVINLEKEK